MHEAQLFDHVAAERVAEAKALYATFVATRGGQAADALDDFAKTLFEQGVLAADALEDFMAYYEIDERQGGPRPKSARRYELLKPLGRGAMGEVYLGRDTTLERTVAVKRLLSDIAKDPVLVERFLNEAQVTAQLDHPAIVPVYGLEDDDQKAPAYAMKFVRGVTLTAYLDAARAQIEARGKPDATHTLRARIALFVPVLNAIAYAHRRGVLHRDLKPDNIMVGRFGQVLVMDWGIARLLRRPAHEAATRSAARAPQIAPPTEGAVGETWHGADAGANDSHQLTTVGAVIGTPAFMSPEQASGAELDAASDQYTLGLILQEIATLRPARRAVTVQHMLMSAMMGGREPVAAHGEPIPRALSAIIAKACAPERADRYPSVDALGDDVGRFIGDLATEALPDRGLTHVTRWIGRHRGLSAGLGAATVLLGLALVMFFVWQGERALSIERTEARRREVALSALEAQAGAQGERMSERLHRYEALLEGVVSGAAARLTTAAPPSDVVAYRYSDGKRDPVAAPPYAVASTAYGRPASLRAEFSLAWGADRAALRPRIDQLAQVEPLLRATLLRSVSETMPDASFGEAEQLVLGRGVPLIWAYVSTEDGLGVVVPGTWESYDSPGGVGYDHRREAWYVKTLKVRGPVWTVSADESQLGLTVSCLEAIRDDHGRVLGVAGVDVWLSRFIDELLEIPALAALGAEALLLDANGAVIVRSSERSAKQLTDYVPIPYEDAGVRAALQAAPAGHHSLDDGRLALWTSLGSSGMSYLVVGPESALLASIASPE